VSALDTRTVTQSPAVPGSIEPMSSRLRRAVPLLVGAALVLLLLLLKPIGSLPLHGHTFPGMFYLCLGTGLLIAALLAQYGFSRITPMSPGAAGAVHRRHHDRRRARGHGVDDGAGGAARRLWAGAAPTGTRRAGQRGRRTGEDVVSPASLRRPAISLPAAIQCGLLSTRGLA